MAGSDFHFHYSPTFPMDWSLDGDRSQENVAHYWWTDWETPGKLWAPQITSENFYSGKVSCVCTANGAPKCLGCYPAVDSQFWVTQSFQNLKKELKKINVKLSLPRSFKDASLQRLGRQEIMKLTGVIIWVRAIREGLMVKLSKP